MYMTLGLLKKMLLSQACYTYPSQSENYRRCHPAFNCLMCVHTFVDENERRQHVETKHDACSYCYHADISISHVISHHSHACIWCHEQGLYAPSFSGPDEEIIHMQKFHPRPKKILAG